MLEVYGYVQHIYNVSMSQMKECKGLVFSIHMVYTYILRWLVCKNDNY